MIVTKHTAGLAYNGNLSPSLKRSEFASLIHTNSLHTVFQPIMSHRDRDIFAYEALSRPTLDGVGIPPDTWFDLAVQYELTAQADLVAIESALSNYAQTALADKRPLFINVTPISLLERGFLASFEHMVDKHGLHARQIVIELTESSLTDPLTLKNSVVYLQTQGFRIALDDLGRGGASLLAMVELQPDFIKIDRTIVQGIAHSPSRFRLITLLASYADVHGVIGEGVETQSDVEALHLTGTYLSQGYYWSYPVQANVLKTQTIDDKLWPKFIHHTVVKGDVSS